MTAVSSAARPESNQTLWEETVPGGAHWSGVFRRGVTLRITDVEGGANGSILLYNQEEKLERYNMADTLKGQHTAYLTAGRVLYSDMGRVLCSVTEDTCGWHDTIGGVSNAQLVKQKYGEARYQEHRNDYHRNGYDSLLNEVTKYGLGRRDLVANVNLFSKVVVNEDGGMRFVEGNSNAGDYIDLRFEMNVLMVLSTCQHPMDPASKYKPHPLLLSARYTGPAPAQDACRDACGENQRAFTNTERLFI